MTKLSQIINVLEDIAPLDAAESWDNVGLLVGDRSQAISRAMLTIDYTPEVAVEAREAKCELVIAYHPPLFSPLKRITADKPTDLIHDAIRRGVAIYSPHTALDATAGGTNDVLADALAMIDRQPLRFRETAATHCKLVTFVPTDAVERVSDAIFAAGGGQMGHYSRCSFRGPGQGTFLGNEKSHPQLGEAGVFEVVDESRVEILVPLDKTQAIAHALRKAHPYEVPAFEFLTILPALSDRGVGRGGRLPSSITLAMVVNLLKRSLGLERLIVAGDPERMVDRVAVCAGAGSDLLDAAIAHRADLFLTGELRHHDVLKAARAGMSVIATLHSNSERIVLPPLAERLRNALPNVEFRVSSVDRDPFVVV